MPIVILPGLDGTSLLLRDFTTLSGAHVIEYPREILSYDDLATYAAKHVPQGAILIGESFGGAIATLVASRVDAAALVLVNSFVVPPLPRVLARLPLATLLRFDPPRWLMDVGSAIRSVPREVLASRIRMALSVDVRREFAGTTMPLLDLRSRAARLVNLRRRRAVLRARPDARVVDIDGPHTLLFSNALGAWEAIRSALCYTL